MSPLSLTGSRPRESPLPLCEVGRDPPARGRHPADRRCGDPPDLGFPGWVGLGVERYPCRAHFPDIGLGLADYLLGGHFPELAGCLLGGIIHVRIVFWIVDVSWLILTCRCENWWACRGMWVYIVVPWLGISRVFYLWGCWGWVIGE